MTERNRYPLTIDGADGSLRLVSVEHEAKYELRPEDLIRALNIKVPGNGVLVLELVSNPSGRTTAIGSEHTLVLRVTWSDDPEPGEDA